MPVDLDYIRSSLPGRSIEWYPVVNSTMTLAANLARHGCPSGTVVGADAQVEGVGRQGHTWHSESDAGLYVSIVLRLEAGPRVQPVMMLALGLAAQEAIAEVTGLAADLRWPNDVLLDGRKCGGILALMEGEAIVAGIGINVHQTGFPRDIEDVATSLQLAGKGNVSRENLLIALVKAVQRLCEHSPADILAMFTRASSYATGRRVRVGNIEGVTRGLDESGFLIVREDSGKETTILAGGVRPI